MNTQKKEQKVSIRFFGDKEVRAVWDDSQSKWWFSVLDVVSAIRGEENYEKCRNYWKYLKAKMRKEKEQLGSATTQFKFYAPDGKKRLADTLDSEGIIALAKQIPNTNGMKFLDWFLYSDNTIDGQSKKKAYSFFESNLVDSEDIGTAKSLQQIHSYLFGGLYDFAGKIRQLNISKGGFQFAMARFLDNTLQEIEKMPENSFDDIANKYVEMNVAHPFMEGNGRSTRIWLDLILKKRLKMCVDWSKIGKKDYLDAMIISHANSTVIKKLLKNALTDKINSRKMFMQGIDYSYYYEQEDEISE